MEMEDEKTAETNITKNDNLSEDQYEITDGDIDSGDLDFDIVDFDVVNDDEDEIENEQVVGDTTEIDLGDLDFEVVTNEDYDNSFTLVDQFDNVIITRTFSKAYGLAGIRLGWCYSSQKVMGANNR